MSTEKPPPNSELNLMGAFGLGFSKTPIRTDVPSELEVNSESQGSEGRKLIIEKVRLKGDTSSINNRS